MIPDDKKLLLMEMADSLGRSWWTVVAGVAVGLAAGVAAVNWAPVVYQAQTSILANAEKLPAEFIRPTIQEGGETLELKLRELRDKVLSDENLSSIVAEAFPLATTPEREQHLAAQIRSRTAITYFQKTQSIQIAYPDSDPVRAAAIVDAVADLFVNENVELRREDATLLTESLEKLATETRVGLEALKTELDELLRRHPFESEDQRSSNEAVVAQLTKELEENQSAIRQAEQRVQMRQAQQSFESSSDLEERAETETAGDEPEALTGDARVQQLRQEIDELRHRYSPDHPTVKAKQRALEDLLRETQASEDAAAPEVRPEAAPARPLDVWETQVRAARLEVGRLKTEGAEIEKKLRQYRGYLGSTSTIQRQIEDLTSRIDIKRQELTEHETKIAQSRLGERIEEEALGNPFVKLYDAVPPSQPISPDTKQFLLIGAVAGLALFVGPLLAMPFLRPTIGHELALRSLSAYPVLVTIPLIPTSDAARIRRQRLRTNLVLAALSLAFLVAVVSVDRIGLL